MTTLSTIANRFRKIAADLDAPKAHCVFRTMPQHDGSRHCEYDGITYSYITSERGELFDQQHTTDADELLFWLVADMSRSMAADYELSHRDENSSVDSRLAMFDHHVALLAKVNESWAVRQRQHYDSVLADHPANSG
jgi:hypothetical protein